MYFFMYNYYGFGVYKSTDGGETWSGPYSSGLPARTYIFRIAVHPNNPDIVYIAEHTGLYRSTNGGMSWVKVIPADGTMRQCNDVIISSYGQKIWAVGPSENWTWGGVGDEYKGIEYHISTNGGNSFTHITNSGFTHDTRSHLAVSRADENFVYAVTVKSDGYVYGFVSTDGGFNFSSPVQIGYGYGMAFSFLFVHASPFDENVAFVSAGVNLYRTTNAGQSFSYQYAPYADQNNFDFCPDPDKPNQVILANDGGLWRSSNLGDSWENLNSTLSFCEDYRITSNPYDPENIFIAQTDNGFLQKNRGSIIWTSRMHCCDGTNIIYSKFNNNVLIASTGVNWNMRETIWNSTNKGQSFTSHLIEGIWDGGNDWIAALAEDPEIAGTFYHPRRSSSPVAYQYVNIWVT